MEEVFEDNLTSAQSVLKKLIFTLESLPQVWNSSAKCYSDKGKKLAAYNELVKIYKGIKPTATIDDVRKKINSLRSNYRKELKRIIDSKRSGASPEDVYTPKSWTFQALHFLQKTEKPVNVVLDSGFEVDYADTVTDSHTIGELDELSFSSINAVPPPKKRAKGASLEKKHQYLIEKACSLLSETPKEPKSIHATALYWTEKLENIDPTQKLFAEKAINDILFEAELGTLNRNSVQINAYTTVSSPGMDNNEMNISFTPDSPNENVQYEVLPNRYNSAERDIFPYTPSPGCNTFVAQPNRYNSLRAKGSSTQSPVVIYQNNVGATEDVLTSDSQYPHQSLFSSFN